jgi:hypothetical protein
MLPWAALFVIAPIAFFIDALVRTAYSYFGVFFPVWVQLQNLPQTSPLYLQDLMEQGVILWVVEM